MDAIITWGLRLAVLAMVGGALTGAWFKVNGWCNGACEKARTALAQRNGEFNALREEIVAERAYRARLVKEQEATNERNAQDLRDIAAAFEAQRLAHMEWAQKLAARRDALARDLESMRGRCVLPAAAGGVWNDAARGAGAAAPAEVRPAEPGGAAADAPAPAGGGYARGVAPRPTDAVPVDCVDAYRIGVENTERGAINAAEVNRCWGYAIPLWERCTGESFDYGARAPWLTKEARP